MAQIAYNNNMDKTVVGLLGDASGSGKRIDSYISTEEILFGRGVVLDTTGAGLCKLPAASTDQFLGVAQRDIAEPNGSAGVDNAYPDEASVAVVKQATIWVEVERAVTPADDVFCRYAAGAGGSELGIFRTDADTASAFQVSNARYLTSSETVAGRLVALLEVNVP